MKPFAQMGELLMAGVPVGLTVPYADRAQYGDSDLGRRSHVIDGQGDVAADHHDAVDVPTTAAISSPSSRGNEACRSRSHFVYLPGHYADASRPRRVRPKLS